MQNPLVTVNILSYNRKEELRNTLTKVFGQDYKNIEVIVVDNASSDGSQEMVKREFPQVKLIELEKNIGIAGWNKGFEAARGEYVIVLDDDAYLENNGISLVVKEFQTNSHTGAIAFKVINVFRNGRTELFGHGWQPLNINYDIKWYLIIGCAFAIRKSIFIRNMFVPDYFISFHELPIILQIYRNGYLIKYLPKIIAFHFNQKYKKYGTERECLHFRNMANFVYYHFNKPNNIKILLQIILFYFTRAIRHKWFQCYINSIVQLKETLVPFTKDRLKKDITNKIINSGVIDYKFSQKISKFL